MSRLARPPYIDTTTGIAYDTDKAEFEGYLTKQSMWLRVRRIWYFSCCLNLLSHLIMHITCPLSLFLAAQQRPRARRAQETHCDEKGPTWLELFDTIKHENDKVGNKIYMQSTNKCQFEIKLSTDMQPTQKRYEEQKMNTQFNWVGNTNLTKNALHQFSNTNYTRANWE